MIKNFSDFSDFSDISIRSGIRRYSRLKSKVVKIVPNFGRFLPTQILEGGHSKKYTHVITPASRTSLGKFREDIPTGPEVIGVK